MYAKISTLSPLKMAEKAQKKTAITFPEINVVFKKWIFAGKPSTLRIIGHFSPNQDMFLER